MKRLALVLPLSIYACGGGSAQQKPQAAASSGESAAHEAPPAEASPSDQAQQRFLGLAKELDKLGKGEPINQAWLEKELHEVLHLDPEHAAAHFNLAVLKERAGDKAGARKMYDEIADQHPDFAPALENVAADYVAAGDKDKAAGIYRQIIEKDPKNVTSRLALARLLSASRQYDDAIGLCRQALQRQADAIEAFRILASSYEAMGNTPMAELIIGRGLKVSKEDTELHYLMAQILLKKKDLVGGVNKLKEVIKMDPKWLKVRAQLAEIALSYRDFGNAAQQFEAILKDDPDNRAAMVDLAVSYKGMGRYDQSEKLYQKILEKQAGDADALWNLAVLYHRHLNKFDEAIALYKKAKDAAGPGDEKTADVDKLVAEAEKQKSDIAARKDREEKEKKKLEAIETACDAVRGGKAPNAEAIGNDQERIEVGWQLMVNAQSAIQGGDTPGGEGLVKCALSVIPNTPGAKTEACAPMRNMWTQILFQLNRLEEAVANTKEALACDPNNPDAQLIQQQLTEILAQQKAQGGAQPAPDAPPPAAPK